MKKNLDIDKLIIFLVYKGVAPKTYIPFTKKVYTF